MRIGVCGTKGGSGKSTIAGLLALALADSGHSVAVRDADPQKTLETWLTSLPDRGVNQRAGWLYLGDDKEPEYHISDYPPASPESLLGILGDEWDLLLVPCRPSVADTWSIRSWIEKLGAHNGRVRLVMNAMDNSANCQPRNLGAMLEGITAKRTKATLSRRACYTQAMLLGWRALDEKARSEVLSLALEINSIK